MFGWKTYEVAMGHKGGLALLCGGNAGQQCHPCCCGAQREGVLRREKLQDQILPQTSSSIGALLAGGDEGGMSYLLLAHVAAQLGLDASVLLRKQPKKSLLELLKTVSAWSSPAFPGCAGRPSCRQAQWEGRAAPCHPQTVSLLLFEQC